MKYWKENINYRQEKATNGTVRYLITIDGQDVEVDKALYLEYTKMERRERYLVECDIDKCISLEKLSEDELFGGDILDGSQMSAEEEVIAKEAAKEKEAAVHALHIAIESLPPEEQQLIRAIYFDGISIRAYAKSLGISDMAVRKRRNRILKNLKNILKNFNH